MLYLICIALCHLDMKPENKYYKSKNISVVATQSNAL